MKSLKSLLSMNTVWQVVITAAIIYLILRVDILRKTVGLPPVSPV